MTLYRPPHVGHDQSHPNPENVSSMAVDHAGVGLPKTPMRDYRSQDPLPAGLIHHRTAFDDRGVNMKRFGDETVDVNQFYGHSSEGRFTIRRVSYEMRRRVCQV